MASLFSFAEDAAAPAALADIFSESSKKKFEKVVVPVAESEEVVRRKRSKAEEEEPIAQKKPRKAKKPKVEEKEESPDVTKEVFVGNLPLAATKSDVEKVFKKMGSVKSVRFRSLPIAGTAVDVAGDINLVKKVCANSKKFSSAKDSQNAYVVFGTHEDAQKAVDANGMMFGAHHLRIDFANNSTFDAKKSVFLGNIPTHATESEVRNHFSVGLSEAASGTTMIDGVRIIRDSETQVGKGFGYLLLCDRSTAAKALMMNGSKLGGRELRVQVCGKRFKGNGQKDKEEGDDVSKSTSKGKRLADETVTMDFMGKTTTGAQRRVTGRDAKKGKGKGKGGGKGGKGGKGEDGKGEGGKGGKGKGGKGKGGKGKGKGKGKGSN